MTTEADVIALFERANPVPDPDSIDIVIDADQCLAGALEDKRGAATLIEPTTTGSRDPRRPRWLLPAAAATVLVVALVVALAFVVDDDTAPSDTVPSTTPATPTTTTLADASEQPSAAELAVIDSFVTRYNLADTDSVLALFADDFAVTEQYGGAPPNPNDDPFPEPDGQLGWKHAQGEIITEPTCILGANQPDEGSTLLCDYTTLDAFVQAVDGTPIPTRALITIVDGQIAELHQGYGNPDYSLLAISFRQWIEQNHPDELDGLFADWTSRSDAEEQGRRRAEWAQEWARAQAAPDTLVLEEAAMAPPLPAPADGETQQSIVGDITWTRIEGDPSTQPQRVEFELLGEFYGSDGNDVNWRSPDGINWTKFEQPLDRVSAVVEVDGETWVVPFEPFRDDGFQNELRRWDGANFETIELPPSDAPVVDGLRRSGRWLSLTRSGDRLVVIVNEAYDVPWDDLFGERGWASEVLSDGTIELRNYIVGGRMLLEAIVDESEPGRIEITRDGQLVTAVGPWPGTDSEELIALLGHDGVPYGELLIGGKDGFEVVSGPWSGAGIAQVVVIGERLLALVGEPGHDGQELWASDDEVDWERRDLPTPSGAVVDFVSLSGGGTSALLTIVSSQEGQVAEAWHTSDGETWRVANGGASYGEPARGDFGWMSENVYEEPPSIAVSPDGITWQQITIGLPEPDRAGGGSVSVLGNSIILSAFDEGGERLMWVGRVDVG